MPDDKSIGDDLDQYQKDQEEFDSAINEIFGAEDDATDSDISKKIDDANDKETDKDGESTRDQSDSSDADKDKADDSLFTDGEGVAQTDNDADGDNSDTDGEAGSDSTDWKARALKAEGDLQKERQRTSSWNGRIKAANKKVKEQEETIKQLTAQLAKGGDSSDSSNHDDVLERFKDDFPELTDVVNLLKGEIDQLKAGQAKGSSDDDYIPLEDGDTGDDMHSDDEGDAVATDHSKKITDKHPDLSEMVSSGVLLTWIRKQKPFIKPTLERIYYHGNADEVIDLVDQFKESTGWRSQLDRNKSKTRSKLDSMKEVNSDSGGLPADGPDKNSFDQGAKDAGLV